MTLPQRLVLATGNPGKAAEWRALLAPLGVEIIDPGDLPSPEEDALTSAGNALLKARAAASATGLPALADDVGVEVAALSGAPGLHTRRWAEDLGGWEAARRRLLDDAPGSEATYHCGVALAWPDGRCVAATAAMVGRIGPVGSEGPALEPVFWPDGAPRPTSELQGEERWRWHHRSRALDMLLHSKLDGS